jgi:hypothetical protein
LLRTRNQNLKGLLKKFNMKIGTRIISAKYVEGYKLELTFNDGKVNIIDFRKQVMAQKVPEYAAYQDLNEFKKFRIDDGNIVWGEDWDLIFELHRLYYNTLDVRSGRKKLADKKAVLRLYIPESIVNAHGGVVAAQRKASEFLLSK